MSRRVLVIESDARVRAMIDRVLVLGGWAPTSVDSVVAGQRAADAQDFELVVLDEHPAHGGAIEGVRSMRATHPRLPVILTGSPLSSRTLIELIRLGIDDVVQKPFTPGELSSAVRRVLERTSPRHAVAVEFASALGAARRAIGKGRLDLARASLDRARMGPLDGEAMGLAGLIAELSGEDHDARRAYLATLALRDDEGSEGIDPHEGLARLAAYGEARPATELGFDPGSYVYFVVGDIRTELSTLPEPPVGKRLVVVVGLGIDASATALYLRRGRDRAFVVAAGPLDAPMLARLRALHGDAPWSTGAETRVHLDLGGVVGAVASTPDSQPATHHRRAP